MRKILSIIPFLLLCFSIGMKAAPISDVSQFSNTKVYSITTARGAWTLKSDGTDLASSHTSGGTVVNDGADASDEAKLFALYQFDGNSYIYSMKLQKFFMLNNGTAGFWALRGTPFHFTASNNSSYPLRVSLLDDSKFANNNNNGGIIINDWSAQDDGNRLAIEEVRDMTQDEITTIEAVWNAYFNEHKTYTIVSARGTWCASTDGNSLVTTTINTSPAENYDKFTLIPNEGKLYLFNAGTNKFLLKDGSLTDLRGDAVEFRIPAGLDAEYPFMLYFPGEEKIYFNMQSGGGFAMNTWSTPDDGNRQKFIVSDVDVYDAAMAVLNSSQTVTYKIQIDGVTVATETKEHKAGETASLPSDYTNIDYVTYSYSPTTIDASTQEVIVTATVSLPFEVSSDFDNARWYNLKIGLNSRYVGWEETEPYHSYSSEEATEIIRARNAYQWAFMGNPITGIKVINRNTGASYSLTVDGTGNNVNGVSGIPNVVLRSGDFRWNIYPNGSGFSLEQKTKANYFINLHGGANGYLQIWNSSYAKNNDGSRIQIEAVPDLNTTITYNISYGGNVVKTFTASGVVGDVLGELPSDLQHSFITLAGNDAAAIVERNMVVNLTATWNGPFELSSDFDHAHWYDMAVRSNWYVTSDKAATDGALQTVNADALGLGEDAYQWAFLGNPYAIQIINKAYGSDAYFGVSDDQQKNAGIPGKLTAPFEWNIVPSNTTISNSFCLGVPGTNLYINQFGGTGGTLKLWNSGNNITDQGSAFTIFDVPTNYASFLNEEVTPYCTNGYFRFTDAVKTTMGWDDSYATNCTLGQYKALRSALAAVNKDDLTNYNLPPAGYYRIDNKMATKNNYNGHHTYIRNITGVAYSHYVDDNYDGAYTIIHVEKNADNKYAFKLQGQYICTTTSGAYVSYSDTPQWNTLTIPSVGYGTFLGDEGTYLHSNAVGDWGQTGHLIGYNAPTAEASCWEFFPATGFDLTIGDAGYATLCVPFPVTIPTGVKAYTGTISGNYLVLSEVTTTIPASTAVVLEASAGTYPFNIADETEAITDNVLSGNYTEITRGESTDYLTLQRMDGQVGFYTFNGTTIGANKAYISKSALGSEVKGLGLRFEETDGIDHTPATSLQGQVYDLAGRRVSQPRHGLYIVGGKKVVVK